MSKMKTYALFKVILWTTLFACCFCVISVLDIENKALLITFSAIVGAIMTAVSYNEYRHHVTCGTRGMKALKQKRIKMIPDPEIKDPIITLESNINDDDWVPESELTLFSPEILKKLDDLKVDEGIEDEILEMLKEIPPEKRIQYLNDIFNENIVFESVY